MPRRGNLTQEIGCFQTAGELEGEAWELEDTASSVQESDAAGLWELCCWWHLPRARRQGGGEPMLESAGLFPRAGEAMPLAFPDLHE